MCRCTGRITVEEGQTEYPSTMLKEEAGTWPGERTLESRSREQEIWGDQISWGLAGKAQESLSLVGGSSGHAAEVGVSASTYRGHRGQISSVGCRARSRCKQSKIAMKVLVRGTSVSDGTYTVRPQVSPSDGGSKYMEIEHNIG